ncbi:MAG: DUF3667 domain-containing protein [Armatimonadota bacterium]
MCLNCGLALDSNYCPNCGQHNTSHNHGLGQFLHEFLDEFLHLDSKILRTLIPLFTKPGFLTQEWTAGKRIRYITPLKLYVTLSAFCFLSWSLKGTLYGEQKTDLKFNVTAPSAVKASSPNDSALDSLFRRKIGTPSQSNIPAIRDKFVSQLPTTNFVLMPIVAGIFALLYVRRKRFYVEHLVFTLHYYSFTFMVLSVISLLPPHFLITKILSIIGILWVIAYLPIALVRNYQQGYFKTIAKLVIFGFIYAFVVAFALFWTLVVTAIALPNRPAAESTNSSITTVQP